MGWPMTRVSFTPAPSVVGIPPTVRSTTRVVPRRTAGAAIAGAVAAFLANIMTTHGRGLFATTGASPGTQVALTQLYVAVMVVVALLIAQEAAARQNAVRERELERRERMRRG